MRLNDAFYGEQKTPMKTVQRGINRRPHVAHKSYKAGKVQTGRKPSDIRPRFKESIPPTRKKKPYA